MTQDREESSNTQSEKAYLTCIIEHEQREPLQRRHWKIVEFRIVTGITAGYSEIDRFDNKSISYFDLTLLVSHPALSSIDLHGILIDRMYRITTIELEKINRTSNPNMLRALPSSIRIPTAGDRLKYLVSDHIRTQGAINISLLP